MYFLQLLDSCLKSPLLPAYLAAAFAKKLSRLSLAVPPSGALVVIALIHNLLRRHPSINCLVHRVAITILPSWFFFISVSIIRLILVQVGCAGLKYEWYIWFYSVLHKLLFDETFFHDCYLMHCCTLDWCLQYDYS